MNRKHLTRGRDANNDQGLPPHVALLAEQALRKMRHYLSGPNVSPAVKEMLRRIRAFAGGGR